MSSLGGSPSPSPVSGSPSLSISPPIPGSPNNDVSAESPNNDVNESPPIPGSPSEPPMIVPVIPENDNRSEQNRNKNNDHDERTSPINNMLSSKDVDDFLYSESRTTRKLAKRNDEK